MWLAVGLDRTGGVCWQTVRLPLRTFGELVRGSTKEQSADQYERLRQLDGHLAPRLLRLGFDGADRSRRIWSTLPPYCLPCLGSARSHRWRLFQSDIARNSRQVRALRISLAVGTGLGLSSVTYFLWLIVFGQPQNMFLIVDSLFWCLIVFVCRPRRSGETTMCRAASRRHENRAQPRAPFSRPIACLFAIVVVIALSGLAGQALAAPNGGWDARAIWNLRARFLFRSGDDWRGAFAVDFDHTDYPLLVPAALVRYWTFLGSDPAWPGACLGIAFTIATVALLVAAIGTERRWSLSLLGGMVLLGTVRLLRWGALQYADVPLAFYFLAALWLLVHHDEQRSARRAQPSAGLLFLAGLMIGLAAWTKNEGLLFALAVLITRPAIRALQIGWKQSFQEVRLILAGALPVLLVLLLFKSQVTVTNDLLASQVLAETTGRLLDPVRHLTILKAFVAAGFQVAHAFAVIVPLCFVLLGRASAIPTRSAASERSQSVRSLWIGVRIAGTAGGLHAAAFVSVVLGTMLAAYYVAYLTTPYELRWHLSTSIDRLLLQLWPAAVLTIFRLIRSPEEACSRQAPRRVGRFPDLPGAECRGKPIPARRSARHQPEAHQRATVADFPPACVAPVGPRRDRCRNDRSPVVLSLNRHFRFFEEHADAADVSTFYIDNIVRQKTLATSSLLQLSWNVHGQHSRSAIIEP